MIDLTPIINAIIVILAGVALRYAVPWIKGKTTEQERQDLLAWVDIAVMAAQQLYHQSSGEIRLQYAMNVLRGQGFDVDDTAVRDAVEAAVLKLHQALGGDTDE